MSTSAQPISIAGAELTHPRHICAFFNSEDEEYRVLMPFIRDGLDCGQKAVHVVSSDRRDRHVGRLSAGGIDASAAQDSGQLDLRIDTDVYLGNGGFDGDRMLQAFERMASKTAEGLSRIVCQMAWAIDHPSCIHDLIAFEARVNDVWARHEDAVVCVYDLAKFSGAVVMDVMRTHPMIIVGGTLQRNPFFVPPAEFLRELEERGIGQPPASGIGV